MHKQKRYLLKKKTSKIPQDLIGNIAILKFPHNTLWLIKKYRAYKFLKTHKNITTVVEKTQGFSGNLRIPTTKYLAGEKTYQATHKENNATFRFNINKSYFSPRLSNERKIIAEQVNKLTKKKNTNILILFAGIGPYPIIIAKKLISSKKSFHIYANELNKDALKEMQNNIRLNKLQNHITILPGDASKLTSLLTAKRSHSEAVSQRSGLTAKRSDNIKLPKFDIILMPRPNLKETFLKHTLKLAKSKTTIFYHGFGTKESVLKEIQKNSENKISKIQIRKAGDIAKHQYRWQATFKVE